MGWENGGEGTSTIAMTSTNDALGLSPRRGLSDRGSWVSVEKVGSGEEGEVGFEGVD